jgi:nucleotide-binding universal stress UspA family protein
MKDNTPSVETTATSAPVGAPKFHLTHILVPMDFSDHSKKALHYAVALASHFGAALHVLHVFEQIANPADVGFSPMVWTDLQEEQKVDLEAKLQATATEAGVAVLNVDCHVIVKCGRAWQEITDEARTVGAQLIIISTHGYTGLKHVLLGSVAEKVVRHAPCPVLTVRAEENDFVA